MCWNKKVDVYYVHSAQRPRDITHERVCNSLNCSQKYRYYFRKPHKTFRIWLSITYNYWKKYIKYSYECSGRRLATGDCDTRHATATRDTRAPSAVSPASWSLRLRFIAILWTRQLSKLLFRLCKISLTTVYAIIKYKLQYFFKTISLYTTPVRPDAVVI